MFVYAQRFQSHTVGVQTPVLLFSSFVSLVKLSFLSFFVLKWEYHDLLSMVVVRA